MPIPNSISWGLMVGMLCLGCAYLDKAVTGNKNYSHEFGRAVTVVHEVEVCVQD